MIIIKIARRIVRVRRQVILTLGDGGAGSFLDSSVSVVPASQVTVGDIDEYVASNRAVSEMEEFLMSGKLGVQAYVDGEPAGHAWATSSRDSEMTVNGYFRLPPNASLIHHCRVSEKYRGRGVYGAMLRQLVALLGEAEGGLVILDAERGNRASIVGAGRAGFKVVGEGTYIQIVGKTVATRQRGI